MTRQYRTRPIRGLALGGAALVVLLLTLAMLSTLPTVSPRAAVLHRQHPTEVTAPRAGRRRTASPPPPRIQARVVVSSRAALMSIPPSFLGISTEYWALPLWARHVALLDRVLSLVRGPGPLALRIGGDSADRTFWSPIRELPEWAFELTPAWLREVRTIVRHTGARLILDLNLVTATPANAARWAQIAEAKLPRGSIIGFEIGNEPDLYSHALWQTAIAGERVSRVLPQQITPSSYTAAFAAYSQALATAAPGVPLLGPALAEPGINVAWISRLLAGPHPGLSAVTVHRYPYSACAARSDPIYPTIARLLSENATAGMARTVRGAVSAAHRAGLPLRLSELNSVTCGGVRGVSNTLATALWAPDALFELRRAGVASVDIHVRAHAINAAFALGHHRLTAHPLLYGIAMFNRMLGTNPQIVALHLSARRSLHLKAWAVRSRPDILRMLVIDKGRRATTIGLTMPTQGPATVQRLLGPSIRSTRGETLAGQHLSPDGHWRGRFTVTTISPGPHGYTLTLPRYSAALLTLRLRPRTRTGR
jgi:hypothetical protein